MNITEEQMRELATLDLHFETVQLMLAGFLARELIFGLGLPLREAETRDHLRMVLAHFAGYVTATSVAHAEHVRRRAEGQKAS